MADSLYMEIVTPEKVLYRGEIKSVTGPGAYGEFQVLPDHAAFFTSLEIGRMKFIPVEGAAQWAALHGGYFEVVDNRVTVLADRAELAQEIDLDRVIKARERAEKRLKDWAEKSRDEADVMRASMALRRALVRVEVVESMKSEK